MALIALSCRSMPFLPMFAKHAMHSRHFELQMCCCRHTTKYFWSCIWSQRDCSWLGGQHVPMLLKSNLTASSPCCWVTRYCLYWVPRPPTRSDSSFMCGHGWMCPPGVHVASSDALLQASAWHITRFDADASALQTLVSIMASCLDRA